MASLVYTIKHTAPAGVLVADALTTDNPTNVIAWVRTLKRRGHTDITVNGTPVEDIPGL